MIHQFRDKKQIGQRKKILKIILILGVFVIIVFSGFLPFSRKILNYIGNPIWEAKAIVLDKTNSLTHLTRPKSSLLIENKNLLEQNLDLKISMIDYEVLKEENKKLKELLGVIPNPSLFVLAAILVKPSHSPYDTLVIDVGQDEGLLAGVKVYVNGNVPIGVINEVFAKTSLVELYSNPNKVTTGIIEGLDVSVDIIGRGGSNFEMTIPFELVVPTGAKIILPGIESEIFAIVGEEIGEPTDPIKKVILHAPVNIQNQKWVEVKKN